MVKLDSTLAWRRRDDGGSGECPARRCWAMLSSCAVYGGGAIAWEWAVRKFGFRVLICSFFRMFPSRAEFAGVARSRAARAVITRALASAVGFWKKANLKPIADASPAEEDALRATGALTFLRCLVAATCKPRCCERTDEHKYVMSSEAKVIGV